MIKTSVCNVTKEKCVYMAINGMGLELRKINNVIGYVLYKNGKEYHVNGIYGKKLPKYLTSYYNQLVSVFENI